jgi:uncharacterized repeat protein (TIGR03803 family)
MTCARTFILTNIPLSRRMFSAAHIGFTVRLRKGTIRMTKLKMSCAIFLFCMAAAIGLSAQTFTTLFTFDGNNGSDPYLTSLIQGTDGNLYGTTATGGLFKEPCGGSGCGTIFRITPNGGLATVYSFCGQVHCPDGFAPSAGLIQGTDGNFYGTNGACEAVSAGRQYIQPPSAMPPRDSRLAPVLSGERQRHPGRRRSVE